MLKYLHDTKSIDYKKLLVLRGKELKIDEKSIHILLIIMTLSEMEIKLITPHNVLEYALCDVKELDKLLGNLVKRRLIKNESGAIKIDQLYSALIYTNKEIEPPKELDLIAAFESEFGRSLSPIEVSVIQDWKESFNYDDEMIVQALKEAVKAQALSLRYIEAILENWSKNGIKRRYTDIKETNKKEIKDIEWWKE